MTPSFHKNYGASYWYLLFIFDGMTTEVQTLSVSKLGLMSFFDGGRGPMRWEYAGQSWGTDNGGLWVVSKRFYDIDHHPWPWHKKYVRDEELGHVNVVFLDGKTKSVPPEMNSGKWYVRDDTYHAWINYLLRTRWLSNGS